MLLLIAVVVLIVMFGVAAWFIHNDSGFVHIKFMEQAYELTLAKFSIGLVSLLVLYTVIAFVFLLPFILKRLNAKRNLKVSLRNLGTASLSMATGDYAKAESLIIQDLPKGFELAHFYHAAKAADALGKTEQRDHYLRRVSQMANENETLGLMVTRAEMHMNEGDYEAATAILNKLIHKAPKLSKAAELTVCAFEATNDWPSLKAYLPKVKKAKLFTEQQFAEVEARLWTNLLANASDLASLKQLWNEASSSVKANEAILTQYVGLLSAHDASDDAENAVSNQMTSGITPSLSKLYAGLESSDPKAQLLKVESWLSKDPENAYLLLSAGKLSAKQELWGKAKTFLESSLSVLETPSAHGSLAFVLEQSGDESLAKEHYRLGLNLIS